MTESKHPLSTDLRGASHLTVDAIVAITRIVESLHLAISGTPGGKGTEKRSLTGVPETVYTNIRSVTQQVGKQADAILRQFGTLLGKKRSSPGREAALAALNGVLGDHLEKQNNPLAISMNFRNEGIPMDRKTIDDAILASKGKMLLVVHGSCMNDLQWNRHDHNHAAALNRDLGFSPIYLHYNTGRHISTNGKELSTLLETLVQSSQNPLELNILAHSMGGLVSRSACFYGQKTGYSWLNQLKKIVFLGTPHHGAPLEKTGNWIDLLLQVSPYSAPFSRLGKVRSSGITDLRYGNIRDEDWLGRDRFEFSGDHRIPIPLLSAVDSYAVAAITSNKSNILSHSLLGDGLVSVKSALGQHKKAKRCLYFPEDHTWIGHGMNHIDLLDHPDVYKTIKNWFTTKD
jgi:pimeloyl-ACP methyl ester carboxylesterase